MTTDAKLSYRTADHEFLYHPLHAEVEVIDDADPTYVIDYAERMPFESIEEFAARWLRECE